MAKTAEKRTTGETPASVWESFKADNSSIAARAAAVGRECGKLIAEANGRTSFARTLAVAMVSDLRPADRASYDEMRVAMRDALETAAGRDAWNSFWSAVCKDAKYDIPKAETAEAKRKRDAREADSTREAGKTVDGLTTRAAAAEAAAGLVAQHADDLPAALKVLHAEAVKAIKVGDEPLAIGLLQEALKLRRSDK